MDAEGERGQKSVGTREWYDFVGQLADILPLLHPGGQDATQVLLEMCRLDSVNRVLDVGCGSGATACFIAEAYPVQVYGIDISEVMIAKAKDRAEQQGLAERIEFRVADVFDIPFEDEWFDVVIVESVLTPLPGDKKQAVNQMVRVVRPGGRIGANEGIVDPGSSPEILELMAEHPAFYGYFTPETLCDLFVESGLELIEIRESKDVDIPKPRMGLGGLMKFMVQVYPKVVLRIIGDKRIRAAQKIDGELTKMGKEHLGYALIVGQKPG